MQFGACFSAVLRKAFQMFDTTKSGSIETIKISTILNTLGLLFDDGELQNIIAEVDSDSECHVRVHHKKICERRWLHHETRCDATLQVQAKSTLTGSAKLQQISWRRRTARLCRRSSRRPSGCTTEKVRQDRVRSRLAWHAFSQNASLMTLQTQDLVPIIRSWTLAKTHVRHLQCRVHECYLATSFQISQPLTTKTK